MAQAKPNTIQKLKSWFLAGDKDLAMLRAQLTVLSGQLPMMYGILLISSWALAITHMSIAPDWLTLYPLVIATVIVVFRSIDWLRLDPASLSKKQAISRVQAVIKLSVVISVAFTTWSLMLFEYGDVLDKAHVSFYMAVTVISCIFCLGSVPQAALIVSIVVNGTFVGFFLFSDTVFFRAAAVNVTLVCAGMLFVMRQSYRHFCHMVEEEVRSKQLIEVNKRLANRDSLTDLANRRAFYNALERQCMEACQSKNSIAVGAIDLDGFKPINDMYGHMVGDLLLKQVGLRLQTLTSQFPGTDFFRVGGDEFSFIVSEPCSDGDSHLIGEQICAVMQRPFDIDNSEVAISATVGIAHFDPDMDSFQDVIEKADFALYQGKRNERGTCTIFSEYLHCQQRRTTQIQHALKSEGLSDEITPVFQPIVDIVHDRIIAVEALARWNSVSLGNVMPSEFIPVAETSGCVVDITKIVFEKSLAAARDWPSALQLSVNLSAKDVSDEDLLMWIYQRIVRSDIAPQRINLEVTETAFGTDSSKVEEHLRLFRHLGCGVSLDDFGVGHSSLSRLHHLPLTKIKIDKSFVSNLNREARNFTIVKSLLNLARDIELDCIVEGVETEQELKLLRELQVNMVQGFYYSKPLTQEQLIELLSQNGDLSAGSLRQSA
ncbi:putative bifunctional diguanylate cyclase/phosphodiesterase [Cohaesibacter intestini]|uniref:putative bifunctional diguanylate cyclase/phosphodiesterase n=1 Tax=Cohaesibacter intestini TaxID=2211145 RepID=UPI000DEA2547|nr:EAL domain-containing protein [Cohaesibacter intestini]